jgi:hypothetical protein
MKINLESNNNQPYGTVSEMRRALSKLLSKLNGGDSVTEFSFNVTILPKQSNFPKGD